MEGEEKGKELRSEKQIIQGLVSLGEEFGFYSEFINLVLGADRLSPLFLVGGTLSFGFLNLLD